VESSKVRAVAVRVADQPENHWLVRDDVLRGVRAAAERGLVLDIEIEPRQVPSVGRLAELVPELRIAIAHLGSPFIARSEREPWGVYMLNVAPNRNVYVKVSGLVMLDTELWKVAHHRLFVESVVRLFGYDRLMFGSDWPNHLSRATYGEVLEAAYDAAGPLTSRQAERLFRDTASEFYGLD
jgi:L-fuconolactonase